VKILKTLAEKKEIEERSAGKQFVYHAIQVRYSVPNSRPCHVNSATQNPDETPTPEELAEMEARTKELRDETVALNAKLKSLRSTFASISSTLSTADLRESVMLMESERTQILGRLTELRLGTVRPVSEEERKQVDKDLKRWKKIAAARKSIAKDMWAQIAEAMPGKSEATALRVSILLSVSGVLQFVL
jgi:26S proteasome regulatory subunit (ATPase 3-interacting protein)